MGVRWGQSSVIGVDRVGSLWLCTYPGFPDITISVAGIDSREIRPHCKDNDSMSPPMLCGQQFCSSHCRNHAAFVDARPATARRNAAGVQRRQVIANVSEKTCEQVRDLAIAGLEKTDIFIGMLMPTARESRKAFCKA